MSEERSSEALRDAVRRCAVCGCAEFVSPTLPQEDRFRTHQRSSLGPICYGGCLHNGQPYTPHEWSAA